ncbi:winged helix-turn-helix domain-containing protein [Lentibacter sp. XHP0401]|uniref:winged helix-turn-helix domain-containing protein n=1 Tax=Lentibacter sp. XHP0401 TaxID=2984334 RepID=UPI0021E8464D|nr:crosslink repair DNA glycosylase YcaQ family protein [Lentibacter sp. XHP0401]MCV2892901.1 winged helix DNA-binding domain-containing protein [Lentibacter sp. XHP0401]
MSVLTLSNRTARILWLERHGLLKAPTGPLDVRQIGEDLGFIQLDSIRHIERAHDHIIWSRNQKYRRGILDKSLKKRDFFEHFTHDASLIPMAFLPMWQRQFQRRADKIVQAGWWKNMPDAEGRAAIKARIAREGPLSTKDFESEGPRPKEMWQRPPHKLALDFMWYAGELATCHREKFVKYYDLAERVFPEHLHAQRLDHEDQIDWLCRAALERLGFASAGEIQRFWDACSAAEVRGWLAQSGTELVQVSVELADKSKALLWAMPSIEAHLETLGSASGGLRILNPFDPAIRDRTRCNKLFGFDYRNEIFVPKAKRKWGYYVYPILEGTRFVGRAELKADRKSGMLKVAQLWPEAGVKWGAARQQKWVAELTRFARFAGLELAEA